MKKSNPLNYKCFLYMTFILLTIIILPFIYNIIPLNKNASNVFHINSSNIDDVSSTLEKSGYRVSSIDKFMLQLIGIPKKGWYKVNKNEYGRFLFFANMLNRKTEHTMDIVVYAGETSKEIVSRLANDMKLDKKKLEELYKTLSQFKESDIFAKRYTIARDAKEESTMQHLFSISDSMLLEFKIKNFKNATDDSLIKVLLTIASIIQKESNSVKEMPLISSVIHNRLKKKMKLQMDATLNYGKYSRIVVTPERIKNDTSPYNTYKHKGLPPTPLGSVTIDALNSAMHPASTDYLFFMLKPDGSHIFAATYKEHLKNIKAFRVYQKKQKKQKALAKAKAKKAKVKKAKAKAKKLANIKKDKKLKEFKKLREVEKLKENESNRSNI